MNAFLRIFCVVLITVTSARSQAPQVPTRMEFAGISLRIKDDARREIQSDVDALTKNPRYFNIHVQRARTYFPIIERIFAEENLPIDFKYLVLQESALIADAVSSSDAVGFWQFKDFTAREMGLRVDRQVDERMNIVSSSRGAARYLKKNNERYFDNWLVSLQAYQMGPGGAIKAGGEKYKGHKSMTIDRKTYWYVKKFLAYKVAYENALNGPADISLAEYWNGSNKSWNDISRETGVSTAELENYNKWLRKGKIPADRSYAVVLPVTSAVRLPMDHGQPAMTSNRTLNGVPKRAYSVDYEFTKAGEFPNFKNINEAKSGRITTVNGRDAVLARSGDRAVSIASKGDLSLQRFLKYNDMDIEDRIEEGQIYYLQKKKSKQLAVHHVVVEGETMWSISQKYGIRKKQLLTRNRMRKDAPLKEGRIIWLRSIRPSQVPVEFVHPEIPKVPVIVKKDATRARETVEEVVFADDEGGSVEILTTDTEEDVPVWPESAKADEPVTAKVMTTPAAGLKEKIHVVKPGETLYSISRNYSVKIDDLLAWNGLEITDPISIDQKLKLYHTEEKPEEKKTENAEIYYTVQQGDTFYGISRRYNLSVKELKELNGKTDDNLKPGERLKVR